MTERPTPPTAADLARWSAALSAIARTGLAFSDNLYERERYMEVLQVAADIKVASTGLDDDRAMTRDEFLGEWLDNIGEGIPGYITPKIAVGAIVGNDRGEILLVQRADSGIWLYPTGWADVGYSASEVAVKEVHEEAGIECEPVRLLSVIDAQRMGFSRFAMYMLLFLCRSTGGTLTTHPLETSAVGWFGEGELPEATAGADWWAPAAFAAISGTDGPTAFDPPRPTVWRR